MKNKTVQFLTNIASDPQKCRYFFSLFKSNIMGMQKKIRIQTKWAKDKWKSLAALAPMEQTIFRMG